MDKLETSDFDVFELQRETNNNELVVVTNFFMKKHDLFSKLKINPETFYNFSKAIQDGYRPVSYHNKVHGTDVCQTTYYFCTGGNLKEIC